MKTNQIMVVDFKHGTLEIGHKDMMGDLNQLFDIGNKYRMTREGGPLPIMHLGKWIQIGFVQEYINLVQSRIGRPAIETTKGRYGRTRAHIFVLLSAAQYLSPELQYEIHEVFVQGRLLQYRDDSGNNFIELNSQIKENADEVLGKPAHTGHYVTLAKIVKERLLEEGHPGWNYATGEVLRRRAVWENKLVSFMSEGLVRDWDHLVELAKSIKI